MKEEQGEMQLLLISFHLLEQLSPMVQAPLFCFCGFFSLSKGNLIKSFLSLILGVEKRSCFTVGYGRTVHLFYTEYCSKILQNVSPEVFSCPMCL